MYKTLMKIFFKENFRLERIFGTNIKKNKGKALLFGVLILYGLGAFLFSFGYLFFDLGDILNQVGAIDILLVYAFMYASVLSMMFVLMRANGYLFHYKDYQILAPMPIKSKTIILSKLTVMLVFVYVSVYLFLSPIVFSYFYHGGFTIVGLLFYLIGSLTVPIIPMIIFSFLALLIAKVTSRFRRSNLLNVIFLFVLFIGIMILSFSITSFGDTNPFLNQQDFMDSVKSVYPFASWFVSAVSDHSILDLLLLVSTNGILLVGFIFAIQKLVKTTNQASLSQVTRRNHKRAVSKQRSIVSSISAKEFKTFINIPIYALNTGFGVVLLLVLGVGSIFFVDEIQAFMATMFETNLEIEAVVLLLIGFSLGMTYSSAFSLSLEGKKFWILKSLPIKPKTILLGKMLFNVLLGLPIALFALLMFGYSVQIGFLRLLVMMVFTITVSLMVTVLGSLINLYLPKFNYVNPQEVVKQSMAAFIAVIGAFTLLAADAFIYVWISKTLAFEIAVLLPSLLNILIAFVVFMLVNKKAESLFIKFEV